MAPGRPKKRASRQSASPADEHSAVDNISSPSTPHQRSPIKKRKIGLSMQQKQALIDNLQLEITERARRLRAQCHLQSQGMRSRIEIRVNRIPTSLRKLKMGDLLQKCIDDEKRKAAAIRPPPVPVKDVIYRASPPKAAREAQATRTARAQKRTSDQYLGDKENDFENMEGPKKKPRANHATDAAPVRPGQVLSPTSSNSRLANRDRPASPTKSQIARPGSPLKGTGISRSAAATSVLSSMVEKAKATRNGAARKLTTVSTTSSSSSGTTAATRTRRAAAPAAPRAPPSRPATRTARRVSDNSETSEGSTGTVVRKTATSKTAASAAKRTVMGSIRKGVAGVGAKKAAPATKPAATAPTTASTGRTLRKRG
ncbi:hypothetical protein HJFPF1_01638 [Paramyrothecium foliicola]|nr:hypothetical protein HJFPF1_01638 [Paramyrothecium foliicola]